ncbi:hypothetical protein WH52_02560 [Tenacibaculum holothuriorum]|uniref:Uncharacterized protein n=1 Tax=Tenacibaculum holothuriorum TaxID=1635173 RepID=A0A1Y2PHW5_9FLAO|nr:hypothetical protein [Tenacibaculum holothuriorum]OSY89601.1 hypothetical protein WH52_02560 [Tenacibaculum holothuriorum]
MTVRDLVGDYTIIGSNQNDSNINYRGTLNLTLDEHERILAKWLINNEQEQFGSGFFKNNILVINFNYLGEDNSTYKGVVVYQCLTKDILDGFWSEDFGNPLFLGEERCFRVKESQIDLN